MLPLRQTFAARNIAPPPALLNAIDRMMPMLRFFRHGDGSFALFNGMSNAPSDLVATLLAYDDTHGGHVDMPYRLSAPRAGAMTIHRTSAARAERQPALHAGCLSFELSSGLSRIVINCGCPQPAATIGAPSRPAPRRIPPVLSRHLVLPVRRAVGKAAAARLSPVVSGRPMSKAIARRSPTACC
jgi:uncharacterized heparinase superfamily protein